MNIGEKLKGIRDQKKLSQGDIEKRTGLIRAYVSRVENGHTVPSIETLEKFARALEIPLYQLFYDGEKPPAKPVIQRTEAGYGSTSREARVIDRLRKLLAKTPQRDRKLLLVMASRMAVRK